MPHKVVVEPLAARCICGLNWKTKPKTGSVFDARAAPFK